MKRFVEGEDRRQGVLLPEFLDDYVSEENPVRVIDVFVEELDLGALGFEGVVPEATGRPAYHPGVLLKIYVYGYINQIASSRRLEREAQRNVELMWLTGRLAPDFKTIADFRKDNGPAIRATCRKFIDLCRRLDLFTHAVAAIDGSKFKAVNTRDKNFTKAKLKKRMEQVEASIERYMAALETADRQEGELAQAKSVRLKDKIAALREQMAAFKALEAGGARRAGPAGLADRSGCALHGDQRARAAAIVGYNVQAAVDAKHHLIVAHEVTNVGHDRDSTLEHGRPGQGGHGRRQRSMCWPTAATSAARRSWPASPSASRPMCPSRSPQAPRPRAASASRTSSTSPTTTSIAVRPARRLTRRFTSVENGMTLHVYWTTKCADCPLKTQCTTGKERRDQALGA